MSILERAEQAPADPILGLTEAFNTDERTDKVNLGVGVYLDESGVIPLLECVRVAEEKLAAKHAPHSYLPITGLPSYTKATRALVFGSDSDVVAAGRVETIQSLGGTGALRVGAGLLRELGASKVLISNPSWENHRGVFTRAGFEVGEYRYYDPEQRGVDVEGMLADLRAADEGTVVVLHACCHNPTGYDLTSEQWDQVVDTVKENGLVPFVDMAYQGFGDGLAEDGAVVGKFVSSGVDFLCATSFSKSFNLYGERIGALHLVAGDADAARRALSQAKIVVRTTYSNPALHGAALVTSVLDDPELRATWEQELADMRTRIKHLRSRLVQALEDAGITDMGFIAEQRGMFSYSGLTKEQMQALRSEHGIYGTDAGRICVAALNDDNLDQVVRAIAAVRQG